MAFDLERYQWRSEKLDLNGLDWEQAPRHPLTAQAIRALTYMMDIEGHTSIYLSELLVSRACMNPEITGFLHVWAYEEMFHSMALRRFLEAYGVDLPDTHQQEFRRRNNSKRIRTTLAIMLGSQIDAFSAVYLTIGAMNELTTLWGYHRVSQRTQHPLLVELLARIAKQERRHYAFYRSQAERHLAGSSVARAMTRRYLQARFIGVGAGEKPLGDVDDLVLYLFGDEEGRQTARRIDAEISRLPGLAGTHLAERTLNGAMHRATTRRSPGAGATDDPAQLRLRTA